MASFFERNKRKSALALLLLFLKWRKGLAPLLLIVMLLMLMSFAPGNLMGICLAGLSRVPGGAHFAAAVTWTASKAGLEIGGIPRQNSYREYVSAFRTAGDQGFASLLQKRSFKELIDAFRAARYDRNAAMAMLFHNDVNGAGGQRGGGASGLNFITGGADQGSAGAIANNIANKITQSGGKSVSGVVNPGDAKEAEAGVSLDEADLEGERAGMVQSALGAGLNPDDFLGGAGAYASKAFFGGPGAMGQAGPMGPAAKKGANGSKIANFANGNSSKGGGAKLTQTSRRGGQSLYLGRRGFRSSKALGTLRGMAGVNGEIRNSLETGSMEAASGSSTEQWEGSPLTGSQASTPSTPPQVGSMAGGGMGGYGGVPGGGAYGGPTGGGVTYVAGDPGIICTSQQIADGMMSDGHNCVKNPANVQNANATGGYQDDQNQALMDILKGVGIGAAGMGLIAAGVWVAAIPFCEGIGIAMEVAGWAIALAGFMEFFKAMGIGLHEITSSGHDASGLQGGITIATAIAAMLSVIVGCTFAMGGDLSSGMRTLGIWSSIILLLGGIMMGMEAVFAGSTPQTPGADSNAVDDQREKDAQANANVGGGDTGLAPAPPNMHYETVNGQPTLEYDYNTFPPGQSPSPSAEQQLNDQKGGGDSGLPPAPAGEHYEGVDKNGQPQLVPDYTVGVAQRQDANSFTGGPPTQLPPAPAGEHYEQKNNGGDPTDPNNWTLVNNYNIPASQLQAANANKGQTGSASMNCGPANPGYHYEGYNCQQVKDYPVSSN